MRLLTATLIGALAAFVIGAAVAGNYPTGPAGDIAPIDIDVANDPVIAPKTEDEPDAEVPDETPGDEPPDDEPPATPRTADGATQDADAATNQGGGGPGRGGGRDAGGGGDSSGGDS